MPLENRRDNIIYITMFFAINQPSIFLTNLQVSLLIYISFGKQEIINVVH